MEKGGGVCDPSKGSFWKILKKNQQKKLLLEWVQYIYSTCSYKLLKKNMITKKYIVLLVL
jgi:hypothetical protein